MFILELCFVIRILYFPWEPECAYFHHLDTRERKFCLERTTWGLSRNGIPVQNGKVESGGAPESRQNISIRMFAANEKVFKLFF